MQLLLMVLLQHQHRQWIKIRKLPIPLEMPVTHDAAPQLYKILDSAQRRKITMVKRDESIPSFSQVDGLPSSPSLEQKVVEEMEEVEKKKKGEENFPATAPALGMLLSRAHAASPRPLARTNETKAKSKSISRFGGILKLLTPPKLR